MSNKGKDKGHAVTTSSNKPPAVAGGHVPDFMKGDVGKGVENMGRGDAEMPRLALMQGLSDEIQTFDNVKIGDFFHTLAEQSIGRELRIVPLYISKRYVLWNPRWAGGGILARSDDAVNWTPPKGEFKVKAYKDRDTQVTWTLAPTVEGSGLAEWGTYDPSDPKSPPAATLCYVVVVALPDHPGLSPVAMMLQRTAVPSAQKLIGKLKISRAPSFGIVLKMTSFEDVRGNNKFQNYRFTMDGFVTDEDEYAAYKDLHEQFKKDGVKIKDEDKANEGGADNSVGTDKNAGKGEKY